MLDGNLAKVPSNVFRARNACSRRICDKTTIKMLLNSAIRALRCSAGAMPISGARASAASMRVCNAMARGFHRSPVFSVGQAFKDAEAAVKTLPSASNEQKLALYALYKQATVGPNTTPKPGMFDMVGKFKWQAWSDLGSMSAADAEKQYIETVKKMQAAAGAGGSSTSSSGTGAGASSAPSGGDILVSTNEAGVRTITFNRPAKRNAITFAMYHEMVAHLQAADADPAVRVIVLTGAGSFFCSGNDLSNFAAAATQGPAKIAADGEVTLKAYVKAFIHLAKPLIVGLNGPCVGIAMTTLPLADLVYASHKATLHAPLTALGQTPEGTASLTFPAVMGPARASELLLLGRKITADTAVSYGLVNEVWEDGEFRAKLDAKAKELAALPPQALQLGKKIIRDKQRAALDATNEAECALIKTRWLSDECMSAVMAFLSKSK